VAYQPDRTWVWSVDSQPARGDERAEQDRPVGRQHEVTHHGPVRGRRPRAPQQPEWDDPALVEQVRGILRSQPAIVEAEDVLALRGLLRSVWGGALHVMQAGDCAEDPAECTAQQVGRKVALLDGLAAGLGEATGGPVVRVGRIAGQFAKPRSNAVERIGELRLPVYRGHIINGPEPNLESRRANPLRVLACYMAASEIMVQLGWRRPHGRGAFASHQPRPWTSHEALLLDYEEPLVRALPDGRRWLGSTHWPWIGERTRDPDGEHVALLADVINPVGCKLGPTADVASVLALCERLDPHREPGRLTFIVRMGADLVGDLLPSLVSAVRVAGHPVIWLSDPMHGNTVQTPGGQKTRYLTAIVREIREFRDAVLAAGGVAGGLHLETTPDDVAECLADETDSSSDDLRSGSLCDPRLTFSQARDVVSAWASTGVPVKAPDAAFEGVA
jgi:3-deoxy-7-phosphoheptulonate synthase